MFLMLPATFSVLGLIPSSARLSVFTGPYQLFIILLLLAVFLYGLSVGRTRAMLSLLAIFVAFVLTTAFPFLDWLSKSTPGWFNSGFLRVLLFALFYLGASFVLSFSALKHRLSMGELAFAKVLLISLFQVCLLASALAFLLPEEVLPQSFNKLYPFFGTQQALFLWAVASLAILPFVKRSGRE